MLIRTVNPFTGKFIHPSINHSVMYIVIGTEGWAIEELQEVLLRRWLTII